MSLEKRPKSPYWYARFELGGRGFLRSTKTTNRRDAEEIERKLRRELEAEAAVEKASRDAPMTFGQAAERYWIEIGQHHKRSDQTFSAIRWLVLELGNTTALSAIRDTDVARLVAKRRGDRVVNVARDGKTSARRRGPARAVKMVSPARVNRSVTEPLRKILLRARKAWGQDVREINWREHLLKEPRERVRALTAEEERRLFEALPAQFHPIVTFYLRMGVREAEACQLTWDKIDLEAGSVSIFGKGNKTVVIPLPDDIVELLASIKAADGKGRVFRYANGQPITIPGVVSAFRRARQIAEVDNLRLHDLRHTAATRLLKDSGNIKMVQKLLRHEDITTTGKYAHVFDDDLREAMNKSHRKRQVPPAPPAEP